MSLGCAIVGLFVASACRGTIDELGSRDDAGGAAPVVADAERPDLDGSRPPADASTASDGGLPDGRTAPDSGAAVDASATPLDASSAGLCPAPGPIRVERFFDAPWIAPSSGDAEHRIVISRELGLHYARATIDLDVDVTTAHGTWTQLVELRDTGLRGAESSPTPTRYAAYTFQNAIDPDTGGSTGRPARVVLTVWDECNAYHQTKEPFALSDTSRYHVRIEIDARAGVTTTTVTDAAGASTVAEGQASSSLVPLGSGLTLIVGMKTSHGDFDAGLRPPWGWAIRDLVVELEPGGPLGPGAPRCDGSPGGAACP